MKRTNILALALAVGVLGMAVQSASAGVFEQTMNKNPIGYWNFETSDITDHSSNGNNLTAQASASLVAGGPAVAGSTMAGNITHGLDTFGVDTPLGNALNVVGTTITINAWVNTADDTTDTPRTRGVVTKSRDENWVCCDPTPWDYSLWMELIHEPDVYPPPQSPFQRYRLNSYFGGGFGVADASNNGGLAEGVPAQGSWDMLTVSTNAGISTLYLNGVALNDGDPISGAATGTSNNVVNDSRFYVGSNPNSFPNHLLGQVDEVSVFAQALDARQVMTLYTGVPEPSTVVLLTTGLLVCCAWRKRK